MDNKQKKALAIAARSKAQSEKDTAACLKAEKAYDRAGAVYKAAYEKMFRSKAKASVDALTAFALNNNTKEKT